MSTAEYHRQHYAGRTKESKDRKVRLQKLRKHRLSAAIAEFKAGKSCRCGESHPAALDFHHEGSKEVEVSNAMSRGWSIDRIMAEIAKCILICSNCHRKLHYDQGL